MKLSRDETLPNLLKRRRQDVTEEASRLHMSSDANLEAILERAADVLGNGQAAREWIDKKSATLGSTPRALAETEEGRQRTLLHLAGISRHRFG